MLPVSSELLMHCPGLRSALFWFMQLKLQVKCKKRHILFSFYSSCLPFVAVLFTLYSLFTNPIDCGADIVKAVWIQWRSWSIAEGWELNTERISTGTLPSGVWPPGGKSQAVLFKPVDMVTEFESRSQLQSQILHHHLTFQQQQSVSVYLLKNITELHY